MKTPCPTCNKQLTWSTSNKFRPFCSERCKLIDLGAWAAGEMVLVDKQEDEYGAPFELNNTAIS